MSPNVRDIATACATFQAALASTRSGLRGAAARTSRMMSASRGVPSFTVRIGYSAASAT